MNSDDNDVSTNLAGFRYGVGVSVGVLTLIIIITLISYLCTRARLSAAARHQPNGTALVVISTGGDSEAAAAEQGLDEDVLRGFPKVLYRQAKLHKGEQSTASGCSICLADYNDSDLLRLLPDCGHLFHLTCVDAWLRHHPTCPICRNSPIPTPLTTPLAEVAPLADAAR